MRKALFSFITRQSIKVQLVVGMAVAQGLLMLILAIHEYRTQKAFLHDLANTQAIELANSISVSAASPMLTKDFAEMEGLVNSHLKLLDVVAIEIYDQNRFRMASSNLQIKEPLVFDENTASAYLMTEAEGFLIVTSPIKVGTKIIGWTFIKTDRSKLSEASKEVFFNRLYVLILGLFVGAGFSLLLAKVIVNQFSKLSQVMTKYGAGQVDQRADETAANEFGVLAGHFNQMAEKILVYQSSMVNSAKYSALGEMAGGIAHEINNPLAIIVSKSEQTIRQKQTNRLSDEVLVANLQKIHATALRISKIVIGLRTFSRDSSGENSEWCSLAKLIDESLDFSHERLKQIDCKIEVSIPGDFEVYVPPVQFSQVLINLFANSVDAIKQTRTPWITISVEEKDQTLLLRVTDCGAGIDKSIQEKVMQPFFTTKDIGKGTGLGLSISKGIVEGMGGKLYYNSRSANTQFVLALASYRHAEGQLAG